MLIGFRNVPISPRVGRKSTMWKLYCCWTEPKSSPWTCHHTICLVSSYVMEPQHTWKPTIVESMPEFLYNSWSWKLGEVTGVPTLGKRKARDMQICQACTAAHLNIKQCCWWSVDMWGKQKSTFSAPGFSHPVRNIMKEVHPISAIYLAEQMFVSLWNNTTPCLYQKFTIQAQIRKC